MLWSLVERKVGSKLMAIAAAALMLMASGVAQAATNCDAPIGALVHGASTTVTDSTTTPTLTGGSATATCNNGTLVYTGASCVPGCGATTVNWGAGCTASAAAILSGQSSSLTNTNPAYGGTVTSSCTNGVRSSGSAVCNANCTIPAGQTWVVGANTCTNPTAFTIAHSTTGSGTDATQPTTGTGNWSCTNGTATLQGTSTCNVQCAAQAVNWSQAASSCTGTSAVLNHGASGTVADGTAPATGNVNITCNNGVLAQTSPSCDGTNSCAAGTVNWTDGTRSCSDTVVAGIHGNTQALADTTANIAPGGTGTATANCSNGSWVPTSPVCNASCGTQTVSWNPNCDASSGAILADDGSTRSITNTTSGYVGTRTIQCNDGTIAQSGGSCAVSSVPQESIPPVEGNTSNPCVNTSYTVPAGVTQVLVQLWGAGSGGAGGYTQGYLAVTPGETLTLITGEAGKASGTSGSCGGGGPVAAGSSGYSGGGRSAIRRGGTELMTAGGGGGSGRGYWGGQGGLGGGSSGLTGPNSGTCGHGGGGGTQTAGGAGGTGSSYMNGTAGSAFLGGRGGYYSCTGGCRGAGGGGGYFGGGGGAAGASSCSIGGGGGGGSGYCGGAGVTQCTTYVGFGGSGGLFAPTLQHGRVLVTPVTATPTTTTFAYTGANQSYVVPAGMTTALVQVWGAGAMGTVEGVVSHPGASGGYTQGYLTVTPGETLTVIVGGPGNASPGGANAFGGGGAGNKSGGGGGRSGIRRGATELMTAGGAGGGQGGGGGIGGLGGGVGIIGTKCDLSSGVSANPGGLGGARGECGSRPGTAGGSYLGGTGGPGGASATANGGGGGGGGGRTGGGGGGGRSPVNTGDRSGSGAGGSGYCHSSGLSYCTTVDGYGGSGGSYVPGLMGGPRDVHRAASAGMVKITPFP